MERLGPAHEGKIEALKKQVEANPDNAMMAMMQLIPMANQMLGGIMSKYGFNDENGGVMAFLNVLQSSDDDEAGGGRGGGLCVVTIVMDALFRLPHDAII